MQCASFFLEMMMILMIMMVILIMMMINDDNLEVSDLEPALQSAWKLQVGPDSASGVKPGHSLNEDGWWCLASKLVMGMAVFSGHSHQDNNIDSTF